MSEISKNDKLDRNGRNRDHVKATPKKWGRSIKGENSWTLFKVMAEIVDGFETLNRIGPCISIFGSARTKPDEKYYKYAVEIAKQLSYEGFGVITGGGPGIMEAANKGAYLADGVSVGLNIDLPFEQKDNPFIDPDKGLDHRYFFVRKMMFVKYAQGFVVLPGGFGTMDELFEVLTLIQTNKIKSVPIVLFGTKFWNGLKDWMKESMLNEENTIGADDLDLIPTTDDVSEVVKIICGFYEGEQSDWLKPNYEL